MVSVALKVVALPRNASGHRIRAEARPLFRGNGETDYLCGHCQSVMALHMGPGERVIVDTATCSACGAVNEFPVELHP